MPESAPFWKTKTLAELTPAEWEALCDGCGWCCLFKLEDEDTREVFYTHVACRLLDLKTCRCMGYDNRLQVVPTCIQINAENIPQLSWLHDTCAYRRLAFGKDLPEWHPLLTGSRLAMHQAGVSMLGKVISEYGVDLEDLEDYLLVPGNED